MNVKEFYSDIIFRRTYARTPNETWEEAVNRYYEHFLPYAKKYDLEKEFLEAITLFKQKKILGSMRALATAGYALHLYPEAVYNCSYLTFKSWKDFADMLILLMLGVGVGYSIERHTIALPKRPTKFYKGSTTIVVEDSKEGWRDAFLSLLQNLQAGQIPNIDYSKIRPVGTPLKTFGGTASGPAPLKFLFDKTIELFTNKPGEYWSPEELFDLANLVAHAVISGGVRRSACIALVDPEDAFELKPNGFWETHPWRAYSNISVTQPLDWDILVDYWVDHGTGEPGIFNRVEAAKQVAKTGRVWPNQELGANPCGEVLLRPHQFCNLTEVNAADGDLPELLKRVRAATTLGVLQALETDYKGVIQDAWKAMAEYEPLLGVSLTGLRMHPVLGYTNPEAEKWLIIMKNQAHTWVEYLSKKTKKHYTAVTTVKPSGTASQILGVTPGLHPAYAEYYIRRVRINRNDPLVEELQKYPLHIEPDVYNKETLVMEFPLHAPNWRPTPVEEQLSYYLMLRRHWADHNPSITVTVEANEWDYVKSWLKENYKELIGITFLPKVHNLKQAPYEEITKEEYEKRVAEWQESLAVPLMFNPELPHITNSTTYACGAGSCEIDEI